MEHGKVVFNAPIKAVGLNLPAVQFVRLEARLSLRNGPLAFGLATGAHDVQPCNITWFVTFGLQAVTFDLVFFFGSLLQWMWPCGPGLQTRPSGLG